MCNLYRMSKSAAEVALLFGAENAAAGANFGGEVYPGHPGAVIAEGRVQSMVWGFPLRMKGKSGKPLKPKPVNNARTDQLNSFFWRKSFEERRCLIPLTGWAEAEGAKGAMTRSWMHAGADDLFACAGVWRESEEWGHSFAMVMTDAVGDAAQVHARMPVILEGDARAEWVEAKPARAIALCVGYDGPVTIDRTDQPWSGAIRQQQLL